MCLPITCLRKYAGFVCFITILIGVVIAGAAGYFLTKKKTYSEDLQAPIQKAIIAAVVFGTTLIISGILGWLGAKYNVKILETIFNILNIIFFLIFFIIGLAALVGATKYDASVLADPAKCLEALSSFKEADEYSVKIYKNLLCREPCPCKTSR